MLAYFWKDVVDSYFLGFFYKTLYVLFEESLSPFYTETSSQNSPSTHTADFQIASKSGDK